MKGILILLLVLSTLVIGCVRQAPVTSPEQISESSPITEQEAINEIDNGVLAEENDIEIGEMI